VLEKFDSVVYQLLLEKTYACCRCF